LVGLVVVGAGLRLWALGANRLNYDESFTAMAGRLPLGSLFTYLRANDSHPPLDYLLHAPLARLGVSELVFRLPSALCSIAALGLFAWWMRERGRVGMLATALMAVSAFQVLHGRNARMYAELELIGVGIAVLAHAWLRAPRPWHARLLAVLVFIGLLTHVSMILLAVGLFTLPGRRTDREAWRWRRAIGVAGIAWALVWGPSFLVQARGGHSSWIPRSTVAGVVDTVARLATGHDVLAGLVFFAVVAGGVALWRRWPRLGAVWGACFAAPLVLAAVGGIVAPVLLDRTLTLGSWGPILAIAVAIDWVLARSRPLGLGAAMSLVALTVPLTVNIATARTGADHLLREVASRARPGDVVAVRGAGKAPELAWTVGVRGAQPWRSVPVPGIMNVAGIALTGAAPTGRVWLLDWSSRLREADGYQRCAPDRHFGVSRILCLQSIEPEPSRSGVETPDSLALGLRGGTHPASSSLH
jgi:hypothetical protein